MGKRLRPGTRDGPAGERGGGDRRIVDDAVADHLDDVSIERDIVGGDLGDLPGKLVLAGKVLGGFIGADGMRFHECISLEFPV